MIQQDILKEKLLDYGCSEEFIKDALPFCKFYDGSIENFILYVENQLTKEEEVIIAENLLLDDDPITKSERQYNGDSLTSLGYDFEYENKRY